MIIKISQTEWLDCICKEFIFTSDFVAYVHKIEKEIIDLGYMNLDKDIVLDKNYSLTGFWNNFEYIFTRKIITIILKKIEEQLYE